LSTGKTSKEVRNFSPGICSVTHNQTPFLFTELELVTPPLCDGMILPGIIRDTVLTLAREWKEFRISERYPTMDELIQALAEGRVSF
jgi:branched-subunit amino acid aminotransferase/4-amino-4-deoxychorismate lyase